jgi:NADPH2:quinone reductase
MAEQKALLVTGLAEPIVLGTRHIPTPGPKEVLVKVTIAGCKCHDIPVVCFSADLASESS